MSEFEPIRSYDAPGVLFSMAWEGELTAAGAGAVGKSFAGRVGSLSELERDTFQKKLKAAAGGNVISNTLIDIATNPFVWLMFLTSPTGASAIKHGGGSILQTVSRQYHPWVRENATFLQSIGSLTSNQRFRGTPIPELLGKASAGMNTMLAQQVDDISDAYINFQNKTGLKTLDHTSNKLSPEQAAHAKRLNFMMQLSLSGADKTVKTKVLKDFKNVDGKWVPQLTDTTIAPIIKDLEGVLRKEGMTELRDAVRRGMFNRMKSLYGKDGVAEFLPDTDKITRVWRGLQNATLNTPGGGSRGIAHLLGDDIAGAVETGVLSRKQFGDLVEQAFAPGVRAETYFPRNQFTRYQGGKVVDFDNAVFADQRIAKSAQGATTGSIQRTNAHQNYHPDDLAYIEQQFNKAKAFDGLNEFANERLTKALASSTKHMSFHRINAEKGMERYFKDTARTYSFHVQQINDEIRNVQDLAYTQVGRDNLKVRSTPNGEPVSLTDIPYDKQGGTLRETFREIEKRGAQPLGGFSLADAMYGSHALLSDDNNARLVSEVLIPAVTGQHSVPRTATTAAFRSAKQGIQALLDSPFGSALKSSGSMGERAFAKLGAMADETHVFGQAQLTSRELSKYLYATHLGLNLSSVTLNASQPFLLAGTWLGAGEVAKAYPKALKEVFGYMMERFQVHGIRPISEAQKRHLITKHIEMSRAGDLGEDLVGIVPDTMELLDAPGYAALQGVGKQRKFDTFMAYLLGPFEKTEWLNRIVTAEATRNLYKRNGLDLTNSLVRSEIRQVVQETQFGGLVMNTPTAFLSGDVSAGITGKLFANPLMRQFMSFPLRSATGILHTSPRIGQGKRVWGLTGAQTDNYAAAMGHDFLRGTAISAVIYEVGKNMINADLSRGLFLESTGSLIGGSRFIDEENPLPVPPVIDIPVQLIRGYIGGDTEALKYTIARTIPAGVAISRAMGMMGDTPIPDSINPQRSFVGWNEMNANGMVPTFKGDGTLVGWQTPTSIVMRALGADMGRYRNEAGLDHAMVQNRDMHVAYRRQAITALLNNNSRKYKSIQQEFKRRFGYPLTITEQHLDAARRTQTTARTERIYSRLPSEAKPAFVDLVAQRAHRGVLGVPMDSFAPGATKEQRDALRPSLGLISRDKAMDLVREIDVSPFEGFGAF